MNGKDVLSLLTRPADWRTAVAIGPVAILVGVWSLGGFDQIFPSDPRMVAASRFKTEGGRDFLLASELDDSWFDITDSPLDKTGYQYGIGKDSIPSIDKPVYVDPDDPRLLALAREKIEDVNDLRVIGYADGGEARAYPIGLLDGHELVNDTIAGKPVTVGW